jgi:sulfonate transport system substrate-binding protein
MKSLFSKLLQALPITLLAVAAQAADVTLRIAAPDLSAGPKSSGGALVDVLHTRQLLEQALADQGVTVKWHFFKGAGPLINEAMSNGQLDAAFLGDLASIIGRASGVQTRLVMATGRGINGYLGVTPTSAIKTIADLKGKRIGMLRGTADHLALIDVLASAGLNERDVRVINLDFNAVNAALAAGQIDASWAPSRLFALRDKGVIQIPIGSPQLGGKGAGQGGLLFTQAFIDAHPQAVVRAASAVAKAQDWLSREENRQAQIDLSAEQSAYPRQVLSESLRGADLRFVYSPLLDSYYLGTLRNDVSLAHDARLIRATFDVEQWAAPEILQQALEQAGLTNAWQPTDHYRWSTTP